MPPVWFPWIPICLQKIEFPLKIYIYFLNALWRAHYVGLLVSLPLQSRLKCLQNWKHSWCPVDESCSRWIPPCVSSNLTMRLTVVFSFLKSDLTTAADIWSTHSYSPVNELLSLWRPLHIISHIFQDEYSKKTTFPSASLCVWQLWATQHDFIVKTVDWLVSFIPRSSNTDAWAWPLRQKWWKANVQYLHVSIAVVSLT